MSETYAIRISQTIRAGDGATTRIELQPILPADEMRRLLEEALRRGGFEEQPDGTLAKVGSKGEISTVDTEKMEVRVDARLDQQVDTTVHVPVVPGGNESEALRRAQDSVAKQLYDAARKQVTQLVQEGEPERRRQLNEVVRDVYAEALKRKARQLGEVTEQREGTGADGEYELVIKVTL